MASCKASAAKLEQCILMGGRPPKFLATSARLIFIASSMVLPFAISVAMLLVAMAAPQPKVLNLMSSIFSSLTLMYMVIRSPHVGLPTVPTPSAFSISPTFRGFLK